MEDGLEKFTSGALREVFWRHLISYDLYLIYSVKNSPSGYNSSPPEKLPKPTRKYVVFQASFIIGANMFNFGE